MRSWEGAEWAGPLWLLVFLLGCFPLVDGDVWWHLRTGALIWERGEIPGHDWFTYTNPEARWIDLHWGFQLLLWACFSVGGATAVILLKALLGTATFALGIAQRPRPWDWQTVAVWLPAILCFAGRYYERPEMLSLLLLSAQLAIFTGLRERPGRVWLLPVLQAIWVNVQGLFILGGGTWAAYLAEKLLRSIKNPVFFVKNQDTAEKSASREPSWLTTLGAAALSLLACGLNPYGLEGVLFPFVLRTRIEGADKPFYEQFSSEFRGLSEFVARDGPFALLGNWTTWTLLLLAWFGAASFWGLAWRGRLSAFRLILFLAHAYLAFLASRNSVLFALVAGWVLQGNLAERAELSAARVEPRWSGADRLERLGLRISAGLLALQALWLLLASGPNLLFNAGQVVVLAPVGALLLSAVHAASRAPDPKQRRGPLRAWQPRCALFSLVFLPIMIVTGLYHDLRPSAPPRRFGFGESERWYAHGAARFLCRPGMPRRVFAWHLGQAAVYIYHAGPEGKVFADPRLEVNTRATLARSLEILRGLQTQDPRVLDWLEGVGPTAADEPVPALLFDERSLRLSPELFAGLIQDPRWQAVYYEEGTAIVFVARSLATRLRLPDVLRAGEESTGVSPR